MANLYPVPPAPAEPVTLEQAKTACRVDNSDEDSFLQDSLIVGARQWAETLTDRAFVSQAWELRLPGFPPYCIELPKPPLISVTSVKYLDTSGVEQTWPANQYFVTGVGADRTRGQIEPAYGISYPPTLPMPDAVRIVFVAGYGDPEVVPAGIKNAILLHVAEAFQNRERPDFSIAARVIWPWLETRFD